MYMDVSYDEKGYYHGECKVYDSYTRELTQHEIYINGKLHDIPINKISAEEKLLLTIKYNLTWIQN